MMFSSVPKQVIDVIWEDVEKILKPAVDTSGGKLTIEDVREGLEHDLYALWVVMDANKIIATLVTRVSQSPRMRVLSIDYIGGKDMDKWLPLTHDVLKKFAVDNGCVKLEGYGRKGWTRALAKHGWNVAYTTYELEI